MFFARTQIAGVTTIADAKDFGFHQLRSFTLDNARSAASFVQDSFPLWFRDIHVINAPRLFFIVSNINHQHCISFLIFNYILGL